MKVLLFANTEWYLFNFRLALALALRNAGFEVILMSPDGPYGEKLRALGFEWVPAPLSRRSLNPFRELLFILWLRRYLTEKDIDLIHSFTIKCAVYGALAARLSGDRPRVSAVAGLGYVFTSPQWQARLLRPLVRTVMGFALSGEKARVILQNPDDVRVFEDSQIVNERHIRLIRGSGVDTSRFSHGGVRKEGEPLRVLLAARLLWEKGIGEYVEASRLLRANGRRIEFLLAGDPDEGNPNAVPVEQVRAWSDEGVITWLGHVDNMAELLGTIHVMALPTAYGEGVPRSLIEAAACGLALVTTDAPGCREIVQHDVTGLLIPLRDSRALAKAIAHLDDNFELCQRYGEAARKKAVEEFDESIVIDNTIAVYHEVLADKT